MATATFASSITRPIKMKPWIWRSKLMCVAQAARLGEALRIFDAFVAQRVVAGGQHQRGRQLREVRVQQR